MAVSIPRYVVMPSTQLEPRNPAIPSDSVVPGDGWSGNDGDLLLLKAPHVEVLHFQAD